MEAWPKEGQPSAHRACNQERKRLDCLTGVKEGSLQSRTGEELDECAGGSQGDREELLLGCSGVRLRSGSAEEALGRSCRVLLLQRYIGKLLVNVFNS